MKTTSVKRLNEGDGRVNTIDSRNQRLEMVSDGWC